MEKKPFKRTISHEDLWNFKPEIPETYTGCEIVDAAMEAIYAIEGPTAKKVATYLGLSQMKLSYALEVCTGFNLSGILELLRIKRLRDSILEHIDKPMDEIARAAGFCDRSAADKLLRNRKFARFFADMDLQTLRPKRYYKSKVGEKKVPYWMMY